MTPPPPPPPHHHHHHHTHTHKGPATRSFGVIPHKFLKNNRSTGDSRHHDADAVPLPWLAHVQTPRPKPIESYQSGHILSVDSPASWAWTSRTQTGNVWNWQRTHSKPVWIVMTHFWWIVMGCCGRITCMISLRELVLRWRSCVS